MAYPSVDHLQKVITREVFHYAQDSKKAAGRALGTLVEIVTFYLLKTWGLEASVAIERGLAEYKNPTISHNVEYSLHPATVAKRLVIRDCDLPLTSAKVFAALGEKHPELNSYEKKNQTLLSADGILRNSCVIGQKDDSVLVGLIHSSSPGVWNLDLIEQLRPPYAMFECKRVGVEEGNKKGPQTIEKAKQGAYVARSVSSLQKVRASNGELRGVISRSDGSLYSKPYAVLLDEVIRSDSPELLRDFILTVGVVSNHGNWFTSGNQNKEMMVLGQSYDWLLFLTDKGLAEFIQSLLLKPKPELRPARTAFLASYSATKKRNRFTKVQMALAADEALQRFFQKNLPAIESWFNVIAPNGGSVKILRGQIDLLSRKNWSAILAP
jgi:hypothetical protein